MERHWYLLATSLFTNQLSFYMLYRSISGLGLLHFLTLGFIQTVDTQPESKSKSVFTNLTILPHAYIFFANILIVFFLANSEINSRVASTCPFFYMALSQLIYETFDDIYVQNKPVEYKHVVVMVSMMYNVVVMFLNLVLFTVGIGFV